MFRFGFSAEEDSQLNKNDDSKIEWLESKEICLKDGTVELVASLNEDLIVNRQYNDVSIKYINPQRLIDKLQESKLDTSSALHAEKVNSDLISGIYEGGFKIWECTHDLCDFIVSSKLDLEGKHVLDLGCGAGLVGILSYKLGGLCHFQDYNEYVLRHFTIPNSLLNEDSTRTVASNCKYFSGDWLSFVDVLKMTDDADQFDFIFTSETIYNTENYNKLHEVFKKCLKRKGKIFLAAKYYYFGVGGGLSTFKDLLEKNQVFSHAKSWEHTDGVRREILEITFK